MRTIISLAFLLLLVGTVAATVPGGEVPATTETPPAPTLEWVRTQQGWERPSDWVAPLRQHAVIHPGLVASFLGLSSLLALVALTSEGTRQDKNA